MHLKALTPENYLNFSSINSQASVSDIIDYSSIDSFTAYRSRYIRSIYLLLKAKKISFTAYSALLNDCNKQQLSFNISGLGSAFFFRWPNGEIKVIQTFDNIAVVDSLYWLSFYPFLRSNQDFLTGTSSLEIYTSQFAEFDQFINSSVYYFIPSHNNHFGHFLLDDLPKLSFFESSFFGSPNVTLLPFNWRKSISDISLSFPLISRSSFSSELLAEPISFSIASYYVQPCISSNLLRGFLQRKAISRIRHHFSCSCLHIYQKVFITRSGGIETRISNYPLLVDLLQSYGFYFLDVSKLIESEVLSILSSASICVCEPGSATLLAQSYTNDFCRVISIVPSRFMLSPDAEMCESGLCYHLVAPNRTYYSLAETKIRSVIQTSDIVECDIYHLRSLLDQLLP